MRNKPSSILAAALLTLAASLPVAAQSTVWNGPTMNFTVAAGANWMLPANQDRITPNVWFARATAQGLFNAATETSYAALSSPADTEWAIGTLANYASLTYADWESCYGGAGALRNNIISQDAVVHLITDDIYIGIRFTSWGGLGGGFSYNRTTASTSPPFVTLTNAAIVGSNFQFSFLSTTGFTNTVQSTTNLLASWQTRTNITGDGSLKTLQFPKHTTCPEFFRVNTH